MQLGTYPGGSPVTPFGKAAPSSMMPQVRQHVQMARSPARALQGLTHLPASMSSMTAGVPPSIHAGAVTGDAADSMATASAPLLGSP